MIFEREENIVNDLIFGVIEVKSIETKKQTLCVLYFPEIERLVSCHGDDTLNFWNFSTFERESSFTMDYPLNGVGILSIVKVNEEVFCSCDTLGKVHTFSSSKMTMLKEIAHVHSHKFCKILRITDGLFCCLAENATFTTFSISQPRNIKTHDFGKQFEEEVYINKKGVDNEDDISACVVSIAHPTSVYICIVMDDCGDVILRYNLSEGKTEIILSRPIKEKEEEDLWVFELGDSSINSLCCILKPKNQESGEFVIAGGNDRIMIFDSEKEVVFKEVESNRCTETLLHIPTTKIIIAGSYSGWFDFYDLSSLVDGEEIVDIEHINSSFDQNHRVHKEEVRSIQMIDSNPVKKEITTLSCSDDGTIKVSEVSGFLHFFHDVKEKLMLEDRVERLKFLVEMKDLYIFSEIEEKKILVKIVFGNRVAAGDIFKSLLIVI